MNMAEIAAGMSADQKIIVDSLTVGNPLLDYTEVFESNNRLSHKHTRLATITGGAMRELNEPPTILGKTSNIYTEDLNIIGGQLFASSDDVITMSEGDLDKYIDDHVPFILQGTGNELEKSLIYGVWQSYALASGKAQSIKAADNGNNNFSILAGRFEDKKSGLAISSVANGSGKLFNLEVDRKKTRNKDGILGYDMNLESWLAPIIPSDRYFSAIFNIDSANIPSKAKINDAIEDVFPSSGGKPFLSMSGYMMNLLEQAYGNTVIRTAGKTNDFGVMPTYWYDVPIIKSGNFERGIEPFVVVP